MASRSWAWLRYKIVGLVTRPPAGYRLVDNPHGDGQLQLPIYANRLSALFYAEK